MDTGYCGRPRPGIPAGSSLLIMAAVLNPEHSNNPQGKPSVFEKHGQHIVSSLILAGILYVGSSVNNLEKQAIRQEAQSTVANLRYEQLSEAVRGLNQRFDALQLRQEALALENAGRKSHGKSE